MSSSSSASSSSSPSYNVDNIESFFDDDERASLQRVFNSHDKEGKGFITIEVLTETMTRMSPSVSSSDVVSVVAHMDKNGDGHIDLHEFLFMVYEMKTGVLHQHATQIGGTAEGEGGGGEAGAGAEGGGEERQRQRELQELRRRQEQVEQQQRILQIQEQRQLHRQELEQKFETRAREAEERRRRDDEEDAKLMRESNNNDNYEYKRQRERQRRAEREARQREDDDEIMRENEEEMRKAEQRLQEYEDAKQRVINNHHHKDKEDKDGKGEGDHDNDDDNDDDEDDPSLHSPYILMPPASPTRHHLSHAFFSPSSPSHTHHHPHHHLRTLATDAPDEYRAHMLRLAPMIGISQATAERYVDMKEREREKKKKNKKNENKSKKEIERAKGEEEQGGGKGEEEDVENKKQNKRRKKKSKKTSKHKSELSLMWLVDLLLLTPLPPGIVACVDSVSGHVYYHDLSSGTSSWRHPLCASFVQRVHEEKRKLRAQREEKRAEKRKRKEKLAEKMRADAAAAVTEEELAMKKEVTGGAGEGGGEKRQEEAKEKEESDKKVSVHDENSDSDDSDDDEKSDSSDDSHDSDDDDSEDADSDDHDDDDDSDDLKEDDDNDDDDVVRRARALLDIRSDQEGDVEIERENARIREKKERKNKKNSMKKPGGDDNLDSNSPVKADQPPSSSPPPLPASSSSSSTTARPVFSSIDALLLAPSTGVVKHQHRRPSQLQREREREREGRGGGGGGGEDEAEEDARKKKKKKKGFVSSTSSGVQIYSQRPRTANVREMPPSGTNPVSERRRLYRIYVHGTSGVAEKRLANTHALTPSSSSSSSRPNSALVYHRSNRPVPYELTDRSLSSINGDVALPALNQHHQQHRTQQQQQVMSMMNGVGITTDALAAGIRRSLAPVPPQKSTLNFNTASALALSLSNLEASTIPSPALLMTSKAPRQIVNELLRSKLGTLTQLSSLLSQRVHSLRSDSHRLHTSSIQRLSSLHSQLQRAFSACHARLTLRSSSSLSSPLLSHIVHHSSYDSACHTALTHEHATLTHMFAVVATRQREARALSEAVGEVWTRCKNTLARVGEEWEREKTCLDTTEENVEQVIKEMKRKEEARRREKERDAQNPNAPSTLLTQAALSSLFTTHDNLCASLYVHISDVSDLMSRCSGLLPQLRTSSALSLRTALRTHTRTRSALRRTETRCRARLPMLMARESAISSEIEKMRRPLMVVQARYNMRREKEGRGEGEEGDGDIHDNNNTSSSHSSLLAPHASDGLVVSQLAYELSVLSARVQQLDSELIGTQAEIKKAANEAGGVRERLAYEEEIIDFYVKTLQAGEEEEEEENNNNEHKGSNSKHQKKGDSAQDPLSPRLRPHLVRVQTAVAERLRSQRIRKMREQRDNEMAETATTTPTTATATTIGTGIGAGQGQGGGGNLGEGKGGGGGGGERNVEHRPSRPLWDDRDYWQIQDKNRRGL